MDILGIGGQHNILQNSRVCALHGLGRKLLIQFNVFETLDISFSTRPKYVLMLGLSDLTHVCCECARIGEKHGFQCPPSLSPSSKNVYFGIGDQNNILPNTVYTCVCAPNGLGSKLLLKSNALEMLDI